MNKVKFKSPTGKVVSVKVTQYAGVSQRSPGAKTVAETTRYMMRQGFVRCGLRAS